MARILITGATGLLGIALRQTAPKDAEIGLAGLEPLDDRRYVKFDIRDQAATADMIEKFRPDAVIHTASQGNVDYCEKNPVEAHAINVAGTKNLLLAAERAGSRFIFLSTNAVFDGTKAPYGEDDLPTPLNVYGHTKVEAEIAVMESCARNPKIASAIVRPILMYGWHTPDTRMNPVTMLFAPLREGKPVKMVDDIWCNPLLSVQCADAIWALIRTGKKGIYHVAGKDRVNRYQFALEFARVFGFSEKLISPVPNSAFPGIAPRPPDTSYRVDKMERELGVKALTCGEGLEWLKAHPDGYWWKGKN